MYIPRTLTLTMEYIEKFQLQTNDFTIDNHNAYYWRLNLVCARQSQSIRLSRQESSCVGQAYARAKVSIPRQCRVLLSFEPAFAGGSLPRNAALAQAYRVISLMELKTLLKGVGPKRKVQHHVHSRDTFFIP